MACALSLAPAASGAAAPAAASASEYWLTGNPADARPAVTRAGLFLSGGGGDVAAAWRWFVACAGGGDIVVLRASGGDGYQNYVFEKIGGVDSVETIKFNDASAARDSRVLDLIARADGITDGNPLRTRGVQVYGLGPDSLLNLAKLDVTRPAARRMVAAADGKLLDDPSSKP